MNNEKIIVTIESEDFIDKYLHFVKFIDEQNKGMMR